MPAKREAKKHRRAEKQGRRESRLNGREPQPTKRPDEVFMTFKQTYHDHFCASLNGVWLSGSNSIKAVPRVVALASEAKQCLICATHGPVVKRIGPA